MDKTMDKGIDLTELEGESSQTRLVVASETTARAAIWCVVLLAVLVSLQIAPLMFSVAGWTRPSVPARGAVDDEATIREAITRVRALERSIPSGDQPGYGSTGGRAH